MGPTGRQSHLGLPCFLPPREQPPFFPLLGFGWSFHSWLLSQVPPTHPLGLGFSRFPFHGAHDKAWETASFRLLSACGWGRSKGSEILSEGWGRKPLCLSSGHHLPHKPLCLLKALFNFKLILELQKIAKIVQCSHTPHTQFPPLFRSYMSQVHLSQLRKKALA